MAALPSTATEPVSPQEEVGDPRTPAEGAIPPSDPRPRRAVTKASPHAAVTGSARRCPPCPLCIPKAAGLCRHLCQDPRDLAHCRRPGCPEPLSRHTQPRLSAPLPALRVFGASSQGPLSARSRAFRPRSVDEDGVSLLVPWPPGSGGRTCAQIPQPACTWGTHLRGNPGHSGEQNVGTHPAVPRPCHSHAYHFRLGDRAD